MYSGERYKSKELQCSSYRYIILYTFVTDFSEHDQIGILIVTYYLYLPSIKVVNQIVMGRRYWKYKIHRNTSNVSYTVSGDRKPL